MRLLLDTHALIWWVGARAMVPVSVQDALIDSANDIHVSAASAWEIATKQRIGKLQFDADFLVDFDVRVRALGFVPLPATANHMVTGAQLASLHKDPFDRILAGQAIVEQLVVVTADKAFGTFGVQVLW